LIAAARQLPRQLNPRTQKNRSILSIAVATVATASTPAAATASAPSSTAPAAVPAPSATAATTAFSLRTRFIHHQCPAHEILAVERGNGFLGFGVIVYFREAEPARLASKAIAQQC
jgi:hypothetical protein